MDISESKHWFKIFIYISSCYCHGKMKFLKIEIVKKII